MAAGLGFKDFTTGEVLTAADVDGYLMQGIWVFASNAARDAAVTAPAEGNFAFTKDTNSLWYYDGAAWVASGATGDIEGVTAGVGISGGGTSGTVTVTNSMATAIDAKGDLIGGTGADTFARLAVGANDTVLTADSTTATGLKWAAPAGGASGLTLVKQETIGSSITSLTITSAFSSTYSNYRITVSGGSATNSGGMTLKLGSTTSGYYWAGLYSQYSSTAINGTGATNAGSWAGGYCSAGGAGSIIELNCPNLATKSLYAVRSITAATTSDYQAQYQGFLNDDTAYTAFTLTFEYAQTGGTVRIYGYQNS